MDGGSVTLDKVSIQIEASAKAASSNINQLTQTLSELRDAVRGGFNNLSKLADSLDKLKSASSDLQTLSTNLSSLTGVTEALQSLGNVANPKGLTKTLDNLERLPYVFNNVDPGVLQNVARVSRELSEALTPLANKMGNIAQGYSSLSQMADRYGVSVTKVRQYTKQATDYSKLYSKALSSINNGFKSVQKSNETFFKALSKNASSVISKIKQIGLSLLGTRTIFTATRKAVSEYMAMDADLTWKVTNNWRALGAQLAPAIEYVTYLFKQFIRVVYSVILALTGIDLIARANEKAMRGWGRAAKDTLGNLQKFDDLNVVEFPKSAGAGDDNKLIDLDTIDLTPIQKIIDWVKKMRDMIKEAWDTGQWYGVGEVLAEGLNAAIKAFDFDAIENKFREIASKFGDFLHGVVDNFDWETFGTQLTRQLSLIPRVITMFLDEIPWEKIGKGLNEALSAFDPGFLIDSILGSVTSLITGIQSAFLQIDGGILGRKISDAIVSVFQNINNLLEKIEWKKIGEKIREVIENIDWAAIWEGVVNTFKNAFNGIGDFIDGLTGKTGLGKTLMTLGAIGVGIKGGTEVIGTLGKIKEAADPVIDAIGLMNQGILSPETISGITGVSQPLLSLFSGITQFAPVIAVVIAGIALLAKAFKELYENNEEFRAKVDELVQLFKGTFKKAMDDVKVVLQRVIEIVKDLWQNVLQPVIDLLTDVLKPIIEAVIDVLLFLWKNVIGPIASFIGDVVVFAFDAFSIAIKVVSTVIKALIDVMKWLWNNILEPIANFIVDTVVARFKMFASVVSTVVDNIKSHFSKLRKFLDDMWTAMKGGPKSFANFVIEKIEWLVNKIISGVNWLIRQLNKFSFDVPDWVPNIGGKKMGFNIKELSSVSLPRLDTGTNIIPQDGPYYLHANEAVVPKKYNPAYSGGTNEETNQKLDTLIDIMNNLEMTNIVNIGNDRIYQQQQRFNRRQNDKYGTDVNL